MKTFLTIISRDPDTLSCGYALHHTLVRRILRSLHSSANITGRASCEYEQTRMWSLGQVSPVQTYSCRSLAKAKKKKVNCKIRQGVAPSCVTNQVLMSRVQQHAAGVSARSPLLRTITDTRDTLLRLVDSQWHQHVKWDFLY